MARSIVLCVLALSLGFLSHGCGKKADEGGDRGSGGGIVAACDQREVEGTPFQTCVDYTGSNWTAKDIEGQCPSSSKKRFLSGSCPTDDVVFSCKMFPGKPSEAITRYYNEADKAREACTRLKGEAL